ncbi:MAG: hypothetical protein ACXVJ7_11305, partial [Acidimicrobiia bacterium]
MDTTTTTYRGRRSPLDRIPTTYSEAAAFLGSRSSRKVGNNTYVVRYADAIGLRLHSTAVVTFYPDGRARQ